MSDYRWESNGRIVTVTLDHPERKNPLSFESYAALRDRFRALKADGEARVVVLTGAQGNFSSGGDVRDIIGPLTGMQADALLSFTQMTGDLVKAMLECPQIIIAAIDGVCVGAGAILAMASNLRYATPESRVAFLFTRIGLGGCDMGACAMLPRIIGYGRATELLLSGRTMSAEEACGCGFFNAVFPRRDLLKEVQKIANGFASGPAQAYAATKASLYEEWAMPLDAAVDAEALAQAKLMRTADFKRAYDAFIAGEQPVFQGN